jgi:hypothetical protein
MNKDGQVVAILNERQVLVRVLSHEAFARSEQVFTVFEEVQLDPGLIVDVHVVELPKGKLRFEALQSNAEYAIVAVWEDTRQRTVRRPSSLKAAILGIDSTFGDVEEEITETSRSASLAPGLNMKASREVKVGDYLSADI